MDIKLLVMDVDGTLTDGKINMGPEGEVFKAFDIKDGYAINEMLPAHGIVPAIITGRTSRIVENRARVALRPLPVVRARAENICPAGARV